MQGVEAEVAFPRKSSLGEGSLWDVATQRLYWVDIAEQRVMVFDPKNHSNLEYAIDQSVGTIVLSNDGSYVLGLREGIGILDPTRGALIPLVDPEVGKAGNRFNDGKCDPRGRFWAGTTVEDGQKGNAALYCFEHDLSWSQKLDGVDCSNGLCWSNDERNFYYIDTPTGVIRAFDYDPVDAGLSNERVVADLSSKGAPDGMTIDAEDHLWVALWGGRRVVRVDPISGRCVFEVHVPANNVTSCAFGGPELDQLYITTARIGQSEQELERTPKAGSLFVARLPFCGVPAFRFGPQPSSP